MDALALQLCQSIGTGPSLSLRAELRSLLTDQILTLILDLVLCETPYRVSASTPNFLQLEASHERAWQVILTQIDDSTGWEPLHKSNNDVAGPSNNRPTPTLYYRLSEDGILHLRIQILHSDDAMNQVGAIVATATPEALSNLQLLRTLERLAAAISKHSNILLDFNNTVGDALFGTLHTPSSNSIDLSENSEEEDIEDSQTLNSDGTVERSNSSSLSLAGGILSIWTHGLRLHNGGSGEHSFFPHPFSLTAINGDTTTRGTTHHLTAGLTFTDPIDEAHFRRWHARHTYRFDVVALGMCVLFHTLVVFTNMGRVAVFKQGLVWWRWGIGYVQALLLVFLSTKRGKIIYFRHRDSFLLGLLGIVLWYHHSVIKNFHSENASVLPKCSGVVYGFLWIPFTTLVLQARFKLLLPAIVATTAINLTLLREICASCDAGNASNGGGDVLTLMTSPANMMRRCPGRGASKVAIMVAAALCTVYCVEWRARRVWASLGGPSH